MFIIFKRVIKCAEADVNIVSELGVRMFVFMWIASGCSVVAWVVQVGLCCCCASRRDVRLGKKRGRRRAWTESGEVPPSERERKGKGRKGLFGRKIQ